MGWVLPRRGPDLVRQLVGVAISVVRFQFGVELHGFDGRVPIEDRSGDPVHSIHDPAVVPEDDGVDQIDALDEPDVVDDAPDRGRLPGVEPVVGVNLADGVQRDRLSLGVSPSLSSMSRSMSQASMPVAPGRRWYCLRT